MDYANLLLNIMLFVFSGVSATIIVGLFVKIISELVKKEKELDKKENSELDKKEK